MKIFYFEKQKNDIKPLKRKIFLCLESLMLVFVMSIFCIFFVVQKTKVQVVDTSVAQVSNNAIFELIELEIENKNSENVEIYKEETKVDFWQIFEQKQKDNNG